MSLLVSDKIVTCSGCPFPLEVVSNIQLHSTLLESLKKVERSFLPKMKIHDDTGH